MSESRYSKIHQNLEAKTTLELKTILAEKDLGEWSDDAVIAAENILAKRPFEARPTLSEIQAERLGVFELSDDRRESYRRKLQGIGWIFCVIGLTKIFFILASTVYEKTEIPSAILAAGVVSGVSFIVVGWRITKLDRRSRTPGIILSIILMLFFPIGTMIGICSLFWLSKRGSLLLDLSTE